MTLILSAGRPEAESWRIRSAINSSPASVRYGTPVVPNVVLWSCASVICLSPSVSCLLLPAVRARRSMRSRERCDLRAASSTLSPAYSSSSANLARCGSLCCFMYLLMPPLFSRFTTPAQHHLNLLRRLVGNVRVRQQPIVSLKLCTAQAGESGGNPLQQMEPRRDVWEAWRLINWPRNPVCGILAHPRRRNRGARRRPC